MTSGLNGTEVLLMRDYDKIQKKMESIAEGNRPNLLVVDPCYIEAKLMLGKNMPWYHPRGEYSHLLSMRDTLDHALRDGYIPKEAKTFNAPEYINDLVR